MKRLVILLLGVLTFTVAVQGQKNDCRKFHLYGECKSFAGPRFKYDGQSRSNIIGVGDQLIYSLVLYGDKEYQIDFCTSDYFKPVHFKLFTSENDNLMYDNANDEYNPFLSLKVEQTQRVKILVEILAEEMTEEEKMEYFGCLGMLVQAKKIR